jgi:hypothetical protein
MVLAVEIGAQPLVAEAAEGLAAVTAAGGDEEEDPGR